jgi:hypothetical protein
MRGRCRSSWSPDGFPREPLPARAVERIVYREDRTPDPMRSKLVITGIYVLAALIVSSADIYYSWPSTLVTPEGEAAWQTYLRVGAVVGAGNREPDQAPGFRVYMHWPDLVALVPFYAGVGPEGGGACVGSWFLLAIAWGVHMAIRARQPEQSLHAPNNNG